MKQGRGSTGDEFRYHKYDEFKTLSKEQCDELLEWRKSQKNSSKVKKNYQGNSNKRSKIDNKAMKKIIIAAVASTLSQLARSDNESV